MALFQIHKVYIEILGKGKKIFFLLTADSIGTRCVGQGRGLTSDPNRTLALLTHDKYSFILYLP